MFPRQTAQSFQDWITDTSMCDRSGQPDVISSGTTRESKPRFSHKETHHDGTAQSVVNEVIPRERSGRPNVDPPSKAKPQQFIIGNRNRISFFVFFPPPCYKERLRISTSSPHVEPHSPLPEWWEHPRQHLSKSHVKQGSGERSSRCARQHCTPTQPPADAASLEFRIWLKL